MKIAPVETRNPPLFTGQPQQKCREATKRFLKAQLAHAGIGYADLAAKLSEMGLPETEGSITVKVNRGTFPALDMRKRAYSHHPQLSG
jgi:hypothetical protein